MKTQKLFVFVIAVAAFLLVGASNATACCVELFYEAWIVLGVETSTGEQVLGTEVEKCAEGIKELQLLGYRFLDMSQVRDNVNVLYFRQRPRRGDNVVGLFCYAVINQKGSL